MCYTLHSVPSIHRGVLECISTCVVTYIDQRSDRRIESICDQLGLNTICTKFDFTVSSVIVIGAIETFGSRFPQYAVVAVHSFRIIPRMSQRPLRTEVLGVLNVAHLLLTRNVLEDRRSVWEIHSPCLSCSTLSFGQYSQLSLSGSLKRTPL